MILYRSYRVDATRLPGWDYSSPGYYFVTICTKNHRLYFGSIAEGNVQLTSIGEVASSFWQDIPAHFPHISLDEFIIMPNHVHGILIIQSSSKPVETQHAASLQDAQISTPKPGSLSAGIRSYKSAVTRWAGKSGFPDFAWQPRFYDHIIRDESSLDRIRTYIRDNPLHWELDRENPKNYPP